MESRTVTTVLAAPKTEVFEYLASVENLPKWATEFARELKHEGGKTKVVNPETGVIDMYAGPTEDELALFPTRIVALPGAQSAYTFTMFQAPGSPDDLFEAQYQSLLRELENIRAVFA